MLLSAVLLKNNKVIDSKFNTDDVSFWYKNSYKSLMKFISKKVSEGVSNNCLVNVNYDDDKVCYIYDNKDYSVVLITVDFRHIIAFEMIKEILATKQITDEIFQRYKNPRPDKISEIKKNLDETTKIMYKTIDQILERGQKLDDLIDQSDELNKNSKLFYHKSKEMNSCCVIF